MSDLIETPLGNFRRVQVEEGDYDKPMSGYIWQCPVCKRWGALTEKQIKGQISVVCSAENPFCKYHETRLYEGAAMTQTTKHRRRERLENIRIATRDVKSALLVLRDHHKTKWADGVFGTLRYLEKLARKAP